MLKAEAVEQALTEFAEALSVESGDLPGTVDNLIFQIDEADPVCAELLRHHLAMIADGDWSTEAEELAAEELLRAYWVLWRAGVLSHV